LTDNPLSFTVSADLTISVKLFKGEKDMKFRRLLCIMLTLLLVIGCTACRGHKDDETTGVPETGTNGFGVIGGEDSTTTEAPSQEGTEAPTDAPTDAPTNAPTEAPTEEPTEESTEERFVYTFEPRNDTVYTTDNLNIRREPYNDAEIVTVAKKGTQLKRVGWQDYWCQVEYNGEILYAATKYLTTTAPAAPETPTQGSASADYNKIRPFGYDRTSRGDKNVPSGMSWYIRQWGDRADFLQDTNKNVIYLTMDEGYETGNTPAILDTLKAKGVKSVFFLTKQFVTEYPNLVQRMIDEGHIIGNHTCSHPAEGMPSLSVDAQKADIMELHNMVLNQFGYDMKLFRFPSGIYSDQSLDVVTSLGYRSVFWSFAYRDFEVNNQPDPTAALKMCVDELHPGAIYLLHAVSSTNTQILGDWIDAVRAQGYEFGVYPVN